MFVPMVILLAVLFVISMPVAFAIAVACMVYVLAAGVPLMVIAQKMVYGLNSFPLLAIGMFILTANLMSAAGFTDRIFRFAGNLVGHVRGGLAHANVAASIIFAGMSGASLADVAGLGRIEIEAMEKDGFDPDFSMAVTAASSAVGPIIPPSVAAVVYGASIGVSIGKLLIGGIIPGLLIGALVFVMTFVIAATRRMPTRKKASLGEVWDSFSKSFLALLAPVILIGGILTGVFTPTESAAIAFFYVLLVALVFYRSITPRKLLDVILDSAIGTAMVCLIVSSSLVFGLIATTEQLPHRLAEAIPLISQNPNVVLLIANLFLLVIGCLIEMTPVLIILPPIFFPVMLNLGIDPIHFGIVMVFNITIGLFTPPFGMGMFVLLGITNRSMGSFAKAFLPYLVVLLLALMLITYVSPIVTFLPNLIMGGG
ncbi:TRAP transporter large permease [Candidatus Fermentibacteria bacterium]|nr:TRAP transporter large permease [Candidatus Fermentibacteria bacterium]